MIFDPASSKPPPQVINELSTYLPYFYMNPSGLNTLSTKAKELLVRSRGIIAEFLKTRNSEIIFTSSSTESNNLAIKGYLFGKKGSVITTDFEHPSIAHPLRTLEREGFHVLYLPTDRYGWIDPELVKEYVKEDTLLVTMGAVCRETATIRDVRKIIKIVKEVNPNTVCHFDFWGIYYPDQVVDLSEVDMASFDGPSLLGPQGIGFLYVKRGIRLKPIIEGGTQERGLRAGEENLFGIYALAQSIKLLSEWRKAIENNISLCDNYIKDKMFLSPLFNSEMKAPGLFSYGINEVDVEMIITLLDKSGVFLGYPSPCIASGIKTKLKQKTGFDDVLSFRTLPFTSLSEIESFIDYVQSIMERVKWTCS
jgi:cysteine desulfurase